MKVFFNGDYISFDGESFYEVINSDDDSIDFQYKDKNEKLAWAHVWDVKHVKSQ